MRRFVWKKWKERGIPLEQDRISTRQLGALLWAGLMAPAAELLPAVTLPLAGGRPGCPLWRLCLWCC